MRCFLRSRLVAAYSYASFFLSHDSPQHKIYMVYQLMCMEPVAVAVDVENASAKSLGKETCTHTSQKRLIH